MHDDNNKLTEFKLSIKREWLMYVGDLPVADFVTFHIWLLKQDIKSAIQEYNGKCGSEFLLPSTNYTGFNDLDEWGYYITFSSLPELMMAKLAM